MFKRLWNDHYDCCKFCKCVGLKSLIDSSEFAEQNAVVIGGSRGLGELVAKSIYAGGGKILVTYNQGLDDAQRVVNELSGPSVRSNYLNFDVLNPSQEQLLSIQKFNPTHLYYFATPLIQQSKNEEFSMDLYQSFANYYVNSFYKIIKELNVEGLSIFYPSTSFIDEDPKNFKEYVRAKREAEELCEQVSKEEDIIICNPRLPKMATDQTASISVSNALDPTPIILEELRKFRTGLKNKD